MNRRESGFCPVGGAGAAPRRQREDVANTVAWLWDLELSEYPAVEERARWLLLDTIACAAAGFQEPELLRLGSLLAQQMPGDIRWPGSPLGTAAPAAATLGAMAACWHEACEGLAVAHGRPGLHSIPVAVALGLAQRATLGRVLEAIVIGYEIGARAGIAMPIRPGLHVDGTWGLLGASAAAARVLEMSDEHAVAALGIAACQIPSSLYLPVSMGNTARNTYASHSASQAIFLAAEAAAGITAPTGVFAHAAAHLAGEPKSTVPWMWPITEDFLILQGYLKPFAAVRHAHYGAEAARRWLQRTRTDSSTIHRVTLETYSEALAYCGNRAPATPIQAQFSLSYAVACVLSGHELSASAYSSEVISDPESRRLEELLELRVSDELPGRGARLTVDCDLGQQSIRVDSVLGDPDSPFTQDDVSTKARELLAPGLGIAESDRLIESILSAKKGLLLQEVIARLD